MAVTTWTPTLVRGRTVWDTGELPPDEFEMRVRRVGELLFANGVEACVVLGSVGNYGNIAYLTGLRPSTASSSSSGVILVHPDRGTIMIVRTARGLAHLRMVNCVTDIRVHSSVGDGVRSVLAEWGYDSGPLGVVGLDTDVSFKVADELIGPLGAFELRSLDSEFAQLRHKKQPHELLSLERSADIVSTARGAAINEFIQTMSPYRACLVAERTARVCGARDVRILANISGSRGLTPIVDAGDVPANYLLLHLAIERDGYWAESTVSFPREPRGSTARAHAAVVAMRELLRPSVNLGVVAEEALSHLQGDQERSSALSIGLGQGVGLGTEPGLAIAPGSNTVLEGGELLALRCVIDDGERWVADSQLVLIGDDGCKDFGGTWWNESSVLNET